MSDDRSTDTEIIDFIAKNNITVSASSQRGYQRWQFVFLDGSTEAELLADQSADFRDVAHRAMKRFRTLKLSAVVAPSPREETPND